MKKLLLLTLLIAKSYFGWSQCNCESLRSKVADVVLSSDLSSAAPFTNPAQGLLVFNTGTAQAQGFYMWLNGWIFTGNNVPLTIDIQVVNSGFTGWRFGTLTTLNPTLNLYRGVTYRFNVSGNTAHPFRISTSNTLSPPNTNPAYSLGTTNQDVINNTLTFNVPANAPDTLFYLCTVHAVMRGAFVVLP
ncbi:hypothetical protein [Arsenicibacter rosenii]|uniref:Uncharacterized protein n=1 Tax=Arsenicibacter rosenii TaxID=1750698 RepID=A0A1S2VPZ5_9BACT|nr:hypothetical protein [Arsenicibacter rosenii]OIN60295.1 hypothetical protein BLX24_05545 [Arsenicibacter rosenii]